jgi:hypothetical protein
MLNLYWGCYTLVDGQWAGGSSPLVQSAANYGEMITIPPTTGIYYGVGLFTSSRVYGPFAAGTHSIQVLCSSPYMSWYYSGYVNQGLATLTVVQLP